MILTQEMTDEQRAVLRACEERFKSLKQVDEPQPEKPPVLVVVEDGRGHKHLLYIKADGTTRDSMGFVPRALYGGIPKKQLLSGIKGNPTYEGPSYDEGIPKYAKKYLPTKGE